MQSLSTPLLVAVALFLGVLLWRVRPAFGFGHRPGASSKAVKEKLARAEAAKDDHDKALALCDAADLLAARGAVGLYLKAMRIDPSSVQIVERTVAGLSRRPRALESVLSRHLGATPWAPCRDATVAALDALRTLYEGPLRSPVRAKLFAQARDALSAKA
jgi:hypothetical protein